MSEYNVKAEAEALLGLLGVDNPGHLRSDDIEAALLRAREDMRQRCEDIASVSWPSEVVARIAALKEQP